MRLQRLWRLLPLAVRTHVWRRLDGLGAWPVRVTGGPARGLSIVAPVSRWWRYRAARHERPVLELLSEHLRPGMEFVDVGSFLGYHTLAAAVRVGPEGRVWAFEPRDENRRRLERTVRRNRLTNVTVVPLAVGAAVGRGALSRPANPSTGRLLPPGVVEAGSAAVEVTTLDAWAVASGARPAVVKIDVEGGELEVLAGATELLGRHRPLLIVEVHPGPGRDGLRGRLVELLDAAGYRVEPLGSGLPGGRLHLLAVPRRAG